VHVRVRKTYAVQEYTCEPCLALERDVIAASQASPVQTVDLRAEAMARMLNLEEVQRVADDVSHPLHLLANYLMYSHAHFAQPGECLIAQSVCAYV
jgi:hypothetical protein